MWHQVTLALHHPLLISRETPVGSLGHQQVGLGVKNLFNSWNTRFLVEKFTNILQF